MAALQEFERRLWHHRHLLRQFEGLLSPTVLNKLEDMGLTTERLYDMEASEIGAIIRHPAAGATVRGCLDCLPSLSMEAHLQPITRSVPYQSQTAKSIPGPCRYLPSLSTEALL